MTDPTDRLRALCLALPEAQEKEARGDPTFRVRDRIFAMVKTGDGRVSVWMKAPDGAQDILIEADPARFFRPPHAGPRGRIGMRLDDGPDRDEVTSPVERSFRMTAPRRAAALLEPR